MQFSLRLVSQCWEKKLQVAGDMLHVAILGGNLQWLQKSLQSLQEVESSSTASDTWCNFLCNLCCNGVAKKVAGRSQRVTCPLCNLYHNFLGLQKLHISRARFYFLQRFHGICFELQCVTCLLQLAMDFFFQHCKTSFKKNCIA